MTDSSEARVPRPDDVRRATIGRMIGRGSAKPRRRRDRSNWLVSRTPWRAILKKSFNNAWTTAAPLAAFLLLFWVVFRSFLPDNNPYKDALPAAISAFLFVVYACAELTRQISRHRKQFPMPVSMPDDDKVPVFFAYPYEADSDELRKLSEFAAKFFKGDTMKAEVVRDAVRREAALGLRLTTSEDENIGFFDVFHLSADALARWVDGDLSEPDLVKEHFEPFPSSGDRLELIVGAIVIWGDYRTGNTLGLGFAELCQQYLGRRCAGFKEIVLYASLFKEEGEDLARFYKFKPYKDRKYRKGAGQEYDVRRLVLRPNDEIRLARVGGPDQFVIILKQ